MTTKNPSCTEGLGTANGCEHKPTIADEPRKINAFDVFSVLVVIATANLLYPLVIGFCALVILGGVP